MPIVGTAGHVDHGKSALVAALTGTNPDRWPEERLRGMTLDLGFAYLALDDGIEAGVVDVPGHERYLHNMLAGAAGMDVLLLVVDANEGVKPQTLEHLEILQYLNVRRTIVAVTKIDLVADAARQAAYARVAAGLRGTAAEGAPMLGVSSVSGEGLTELRSRLADALRTLPQRESDAPAYLPIDRVFALPGIGTVVTGTLMQGSVATGDVLSLEPSGKRARVRGIEVFGKARTRVDAGSRIALDLAGVDRHDIARGAVAVSPEFRARADFTVRFTPIERAIGLLRRRTPVRAYLGSAEILGLLVLERLPERPEELRAELHLREPTVAFPGVRFVVRRPSPKTLLGGGYVEKLELGPVDDVPSPTEAAVLAALATFGLAGSELAPIALLSNVREDAAREALEALAARNEVLLLRRPSAYVDGAVASGLLGRVLEHVERAQAVEPWAMGVTSLALARIVEVPEPLLVRILASFVRSGRLAGRAGYYATLDHRPALTTEQRELFDELVPADETQTCRPIAFAAVAGIVRRSNVPGAGKAFDTLLASGALAKVGGDLYRGAAIATIRARVRDYLLHNDRMTAAQFRDLIGTSRKYAMPLLEWLDARGLTLRDGDFRTLRVSSGDLPPSTMDERSHAD
jgi:selenocysteine-specific elongation factor